MGFCFSGIDEVYLVSCGGCRFVVWLLLKFLMGVKVFVYWGLIILLMECCSLLFLMFCIGCYDGS